MIRWGILGTGQIAKIMAADLKNSQESSLYAVASRTEETATLFAQEYGVEKAYASYEEMLADPCVDVVYIATPHMFHYENMLLCLQYGKAILCEKAFTMNAKQAEEIIKRAQEKNIFVMEAHWSQFLPAVIKAKEIVKQGTIGTVKSMRADFCKKIPPHFSWAKRIFERSLGGGGMLDLAVYNIAFALEFLGPVQKVRSHVSWKNNIDESGSLLLTHESGASSSLSYSIVHPMPNNAVIAGEKGYVKIHDPFHAAQTITVFQENTKELKEIHLPFMANGYIHEVQEVVRCLKEGKIESPLFPLSKTLDILKITDLAIDPKTFLYDTQ